MKLQLLVLTRSSLRRNFHRSVVAKSCRVSSEVDSIIRVDHAGELGADRIYAGQMAVLGNTKVGPTIQHMWDQEKVHRATFEKLIRKYRVRPTALVPIWNVAGFMLGAGTALMGEKAAMACTVAVESVIVDHYNDQLRTLMADPERNKELLETIQKFRDEEQEHHDCGLDHGAEQAPFYKGLTEVIKVGCKTAIAISKFQGSLFDRPRTDLLSTRRYSTSAGAQKKWDLYAGICLERKPLILKKLNAIESKHHRTLQEVEFENSYKSDHELWLENNETYSKTVETKDATMNALDFEDAWNKEFEAFRLPPTVTEADEKGDDKSPLRKLDSHLLLVTLEKLGKDDLWTLPCGMRREGENLRETAERILREKCGEKIQATFLGNAPCGFYKYKYPAAVQTDSVVGAKIFYFKAVYFSGQVEKSDGVLDFRWASRGELEKLFSHKKYLNSVKMFLIDEDDEEPDDVRKERSSNT